MNTLRTLEDEGFSVTYLPLQSNGILDLEVLEKAIREDTLAASIMMVNNEIGTLQNIEEIGKILRKRKIYFHSDIAQAYGKLPIDVNKFNIDLASISSHKVYGPKGIGAMYLRKKPRVKLSRKFLLLSNYPRRRARTRSQVRYFVPFSLCRIR